MREGEEHRDRKEFRKRFDAIDWSDRADGTDAAWDNATYASDHPKPRDGTGSVSFSSGVAVEQVAEMNKRHSWLSDGVKFLPNGDVKFKDRASRNKYLRSQRMIDHNETCGGNPAHHEGWNPYGI